MRVGYLLAGFAFLACSAWADSVKELRKAIDESNTKFFWGQDENNSATPPAIEYHGPGKLTYTRTNQAGETLKYNVLVGAVSLFEGGFPVKLKSTTCPGIKTELNCNIHVAYPGISYHFVPFDPKQKLLKNFQPVIGEYNNKLIPELMPMKKLTLQCSDWSWALNSKSKRVELLEVGVVAPSYSPDLMMNLKDQEQLTDSTTCDPKVGCEFGHLQESGFAFFSEEMSWYLEVQRNERETCTAEFESRPSSLFEKFEAARNNPPDAPSKYNRPELLAKVQSRLTAEMIDGWVDSKIKEQLSPDRFGSSGSTSDLLSIPKFPWLIFFGVADSRSSMSGNGDQPPTVGMKDNMEDR